MPLFDCPAKLQCTMLVGSPLPDEG